MAEAVVFLLYCRRKSQAAHKTRTIRAKMIFHTKGLKAEADGGRLFVIGLIFAVGVLANLTPQ